MGVIALVVLMLFADAPAMAAQGDCGQPVSSGAQPIASDCLFILRAAVGSETCSPECVCDTNGAGGTTASDALVCLKKAVGQAVDLSCVCGFGPVGDEAQINTYTTSDQRRPSVAADTEGNLIVAWESNGSSESDSDATSVQVRRFLSTGAPAGDQLQVNTFTTSFQSFVSLAAASDGAFVIAWSNSGGNPSDTSNSVRARLFDASGAAVGADFQVNSYTSGSQTVPSVGMDGAGNFVVVWQSEGSDGTDVSGVSIQGQRYDSSGAAIGTEFQINTYTTDAQTGPAVAVAPNGRFVVVWTNGALAGPQGEAAVQGQRFDQSGAAAGTEFTASTFTARALSAEVAIAANGGFVVVWNGTQDAGFYNFESIQGQRFDTDGAPLGAEFKVNSYTTGVQAEPSVASLSGGAFVVVWHNTGYAPFGIGGQFFDAEGNVFGTEFQANTDPSGYKLFPDIAAGANNGFAVVWQSQGSAGSDSAGFSIQGQRFE